LWPHFEGGGEKSPSPLVRCTPLQGGKGSTQEKQESCDCPSTKPAMKKKRKRLVGRINFVHQKNSRCARGTEIFTISIHSIHRGEGKKVLFIAHTGKRKKCSRRTGFERGKGGSALSSRTATHRVQDEKAAQAVSFADLLQRKGLDTEREKEKKKRARMAALFSSHRRRKGTSRLKSAP